MNLVPVAGHPYVLAWSGVDQYGNSVIRTACRFCGNNWSRDCQFPDKAPVWVARYGALHAHDRPDVRANFENAFHVGLQQFNMRHRGW